MLKSIKILRERVENWDAYPFSVATIRNLDELNLRSRVCLLAGENGTGKSTVLEAIAAHYGFGRSSFPGCHQLHQLTLSMAIRRIRAGFPYFPFVWNSVWREGVYQS